MSVYILFTRDYEQPYLRFLYKPDSSNVGFVSMAGLVQQSAKMFRMPY